MNYYIPQWEERTSYGFRRIDPYGKLFEERIIYLGTPISDDVANAVIAQLLCLQSMNPDQDISIYINSPGGSFTALTAIYDTMQFVKPEIQTICMGQAASAAAVLLDLIAEHTGQPVEQVIADADRDRWFTAEQAQEYGLVDQVITSAREAADDGRPARQKD